MSSSSCRESAARFDDLVWRVRAEYCEMPGLRLTTAQARSLFALDGGTCETVLDRLCRQGFLRCDRHGRYGRTNDA